MTTEKRHAARYPIVATVEVRERHTGIGVHARTSDLSATGCYVDTLNPLLAGTEVELRIKHNGEILTIRGIVAYSKPHMGMGVQFDSLREAQLKVLQRWTAQTVTPLSDLQ